jgi:vancomycin resistance protein YoaR
MTTRTLSSPPSAGADHGRGWVGPLLAVLALLVVVVGGYVGAAYALADRVPFNTSVGGVDIGGRSADEAVAMLTEEYGDRAGEPVEVSVGADVDSIDPEQAGLALDIEGTVDRVTGFSLHPADLWRHVVGAGRLGLSTDVDDARLRAAITEVAGRLDVEPTDGDVTFPDGIPTRSVPFEGRTVDVAAAAAAVESMWLSTDGPVPLPADTVPVEIGAAEVDAAMAVAENAVADSLVVVVGDREVALSPRVFGSTLGFEPTAAGTLALTVDAEALRAATLAADGDLEVAPSDASVVLSGGRPTVVPGSNGRALPPDALAEAALVALAPDGDRRAVVEGAVVEPEFSTADAEALGVREVVSTFSTNYPDNPDRTNNLAIAARTINGTLLRPGEEFNLNDALGERTTAKGYRAAGVISNGRLVEGVGGGVSQVSTTVYNAAFFAGLDILTFKPHSFYISRYPEGRESTLNYDPRVDMAFRNDTDTGILIQASVGGGQITVTFWGTKTWDVESVTSPRRDATTPETIYDPAPDCQGQSPIPGFTVDTTRIWKRDGAEVKRETNTWRYLSADRIICGTGP